MRRLHSESSQEIEAQRKILSQRKESDGQASNAFISDYNSQEHYKKVYITF